MKQLFSAVLLLMVSLYSFGQRELKVVDVEGDEPMPFVKIFPNVGEAFFTSIDGEADIPNDATSLQLHFAGYRDTTIVIGDAKNITVRMKILPTNFDEVVILPGENPALRIINKATENRKKNHPLENDAFTYESYSKFIFDMDTAFTKKVMTMPEDTSQYMINLIKSQHLFMMESTSERKFIPPARDRENITAYKASGLNNPVLSTFAQSMQSFHFYDNQFDVAGNKYYNPIALGGTKRYFFLIEDTTIVGTDTTFMISFRPRPDANVDALKGKLFINTNGFAIEKVIAEPAKDSESATYIKIIQEYKLIDGKKWFPVDLKTKVELKGLQMSLKDEKGYVIGSGNTYVTNIKLNPDDLKKRGFGNVALATNADAGDMSDEEWSKLRRDTLSSRENTTYRVLDSFSKEQNFDRKLNALMALTTGKVRMGYVSLPLNRIIDYNFHEGYRLGAGLETSDRLMRNIVVGGYFAWGTRDKDWKYGGYSTFHLNKRLGISIDLRYQQDVLNRGSNHMIKTNWDIMSPTLFTNFYQKFMDRQRLAEMTFTVAPLGNLTMHLSANYQRIEFTRNYLFTNEAGTTFNKMDLAETALELKWNIRQRIVVLGDIRMAQPTNYPKIQLKITKGWSGIANAASDYVRLFVAIDEDVQSLRFGKLNLHLEASQSFGDVPMLLKQYAVGTRQDWNVVTVNALETVFPGEFYHDRQASLIARYSFPVIKTKKKWFAPEFILHHGIGYGDMRDKSQHNMKFWTMDKGVFEGGLILSGIMNTRFTKLGLGAFYRYGYHTNTDPLKNLVPKISIKFVGFN
jgi:hypothetical protein